MTDHDEERFQALDQALAVLQPRELHVLRLRFRDRLTLKAAGQILGICDTRVHEIQRNAIWILRRRLFLDSRHLFPEFTREYVYIYFNIYQL